MQLLGAKRIHTTACHSMSNVEHFHRQLKASLKCQPIPTKWVSALPLVLLGIRTALKQDLRCSSAGANYGTTLHLPGEFKPSCVAKLWDSIQPHQRVIQNNDRHTPTRPWRPARTFLCSVMQYDLPCNLLMTVRSRNAFLIE